MKKTEEQHHREIIKAVAQAWHSHSTATTTASTNEFDTRRRNFKNNPTRFKLEAINKPSPTNGCSTSWDFNQSLWDSYEIVAVSKRLESGLVLDLEFNESSQGRVHKSKESKNSLRNLLYRTSSRRFLV